MGVGIYEGEKEEMKKVLLVTFSDNADHQDTLFGMYEEMRKRKDWDAYLLCIKTPKVGVQQSDHTWLVDCPERPGVTKKTFNLPLLFSIIHRIRKEHFDAIYFESLHTWNLPIMMMAGKAKTYQVIHEVIPHEGDSQVKMVDLMNKSVVKLSDTIVLRNKTYIRDLIDRYGISAGRVKYLELWRRYPVYTEPVHSGRVLFFGRINDYLVDVGLEKCQISDLKQRDYSFVEKIDWNRVYSRIDIRRKESLGYLKYIVEQDSVNSK